MSVINNKNKINHAVGLVLYIFITGFFIYTLKVQRSMKRENASEEVKVLKKYRSFFFTGWNFGLQIVFMSIAILDTLAYLLDFPLKIKKNLTRIRSYTFTTLVLPVGLMVSSIFWILFKYDRELIFPKALDTYLPLWVNHTLHTAIVIPILVELLLPKNYCFVQFKSAIRGLTVYLLMYQIIYFSLFLIHGVWLYPIYNHLTWIQRIIFTLILNSIGVMYLKGGIAIQNLKRKQKIK